MQVVGAIGVAQSSMPTIAEQVLLDTNVLLAATDEDRASHHDALAVLNMWPMDGVTLHVSGQVLREYLAVASRPTEVNGLGLRMEDALTNMEAVLARTTLVEETAAVADQLRELLRLVDCTGTQVHDANVVATMLTHGIGAVVTEDIGDFGRFDAIVDIIALRPT